jgi:hypothetical protein
MKKENDDDEEEYHKSLPSVFDCSQPGLWMSRPKRTFYHTQGEADGDRGEDEDMVTTADSLQVKMEEEESESEDHQPEISGELVEALLGQEHEAQGEHYSDEDDEEEEEEEKGTNSALEPPIGTAAIRELLAKWEEMQATVLAHYPYRVVAARAGHVYSKAVLRYFIDLLAKREISDSTTEPASNLNDEDGR